MSLRKWIWGLSLSVWLVCTFWYTDFGGPLTDGEIRRGLQTLGDRDGSPELAEKLLSFLKNDTGNQFIMVNSLQMNPDPPPMPGFSEGGSAEDYTDHYMEHMYAQLLKRASHPVFMATGQDFVADITGIDRESASGWDTAALFRYRSRRSFLEIITHPAMDDRHDYKIAALTKTIAYAVEPKLYLSDLRFILLLILGFLTALIDIALFGRSNASRPATQRSD